MKSNPTFQNLAGTHQIDRFLMENAAYIIAEFHQNLPQINESKLDLYSLPTQIRAAHNQRLETVCFRQCHNDFRLTNLSQVDSQNVLYQN